MKKLLYVLLGFLPCAVHAAELSDCDNKPYEVTVTNGGSSRVIMLTPSSGIIREYGPVVSFKILGHEAIITHEPDEEYCIWHGNITLQHIGSFGNAHSSGSFR